MGDSPRVFISYSHADEAWKNRVVNQLGVLAQEGPLSVWDDRRIDAGDAWLPEIEAAMASCNVALLLVSAQFLTSKFILGTEVPRLLQRREQAGVRVIPVILEPCAWTKVGWLKEIQARPKDGKALSGMTKHKRSAALAALAEEIHDLAQTPALGAITPSRLLASPSSKINLSSLPAGASDFLGREDELNLLDEAWDDGGHTQVVELVAPGGVGKTALVKRWLDRLKGGSWRGAQRVYGWSFFSQGSSEDRQGSDDSFLTEALRWFGVAHDSALSSWDKGELLADAVASSRTLLVLDGIEPLQYPPGPLGGQLRAPGVQALLGRLLLSARHAGLCVLTTRERIRDLNEYERSADHPTGALVQYDLGNLSEANGARLLHKLGVQRAGVASIANDDGELKQATREVQGHALTLSLLGGYLVLAYAGDILQRDKVDLAEADRTQGGNAFKVIAAYERWFEREGDAVARELAVLRLLGFFDRPADAACLAVLRRAPVIVGLTEPLAGMSDVQWNICVTRLAGCELLSQPDTSGTIDAHPLVREYLANALRERQPDAWREGHRRLYEYLKGSVPYRPEELAGLQPLFQAVVHGCIAGLQQETLEVYKDRILRGQTYATDWVSSRAVSYAWKELGAFGDCLRAVTCFFEEPWKRVSQALSEIDQSGLLSGAAVHLFGLGRLTEALEPARSALEIRITRKNWNNAAISADNLSALELILGGIAAAVEHAKQSVDFARQEGDELIISTSATLATALHQQGQVKSALQRFRDTELVQILGGGHQWLYSSSGFHYCDLLLGWTERAAWQRQLDASAGWGYRVRQRATALLNRGLTVKLAFKVMWAQLAARQQQLNASSGIDGQSIEEFDENLSNNLYRLWNRMSSGGYVPPPVRRVDIPRGEGRTRPLGTGWSYCAWSRVSILLGSLGLIIRSTDPKQTCLEVERRATWALEMSKNNNWIRECGLAHLTIARCVLYRALLGRTPVADAVPQIRQAVDPLRASGFVHQILGALLTRAWVRFATEDPAAARADLDDAWRIAARSDMRLLMADIQLYRGRLFHDKTALAKARVLIEECGYGRRIPELGDAEEAAKSWQ